MMNQNKFAEANKLFYMNVQLFPASANVYDSYAESFWKMGNAPEAIKYYEMAIAKDPNGATGESARKQLEQVKKGF
jgi:tetratricopeptide (TPR) repeat protein